MDVIGPKPIDVLFKWISRDHEPGLNPVGLDDIETSHTKPGAVLGNVDEPLLIPAPSLVCHVLRKRRMEYADTFNAGPVWTPAEYAAKFLDGMHALDGSVRKLAELVDYFRFRWCEGDQDSSEDELEALHELLVVPVSDGA